LAESTPRRYAFADLPRAPVYTVEEAEAMMEAFQARLDDPDSDVTIPEICERMVTVVRHLHWDYIEEEREFILSIMLEDDISDDEALEYLTGFIRYGLEQDFTPNATEQELDEMSRPLAQDPDEAKCESLDFAALLHWIKDGPYHESFRTVMSLRYDAPPLEDPWRDGI
jgi:hypothetical protein